MQYARSHPTTSGLYQAGLALAGMIGASLVIAGGLLWFPAPVVAGGLALLLGLPLVFSRPYLGLLAFLLLMYVHPEQWFPEVEPLRLPLLIAIFTLVAWLFQLLRKTESFRWTAHLGWMALFAAAMVLSGGQAAGGGGRLGMTVMEAVRLALLFLLVQQLMSTEARARLAIHWHLALTVLLAGFAIYGWTSGTSVLLDRGVRRAIVLVGNFDDPNDLAAYLVAVVPVALMLALQRGGLRRLFGIGALAAVIPAVFLCGSRGGLLALTVGLGAFVFRRVGWKGQALLAGSTVLAVFAVAILPAAAALGVKGDDSAMGRIAAWSAGLEMFRNNPLLGVGYRAFTEHHPIPAHNSFVNVLAEGGLLGALAWVGLNYWALLTLFQVERGGAELGSGGVGERGSGGRGDAGTPKPLRSPGQAQGRRDAGSPKALPRPITEAACTPVGALGRREAGTRERRDTGTPARGDQVTADKGAGSGAGRMQDTALSGYAAAVRAGLLASLTAGMFLSHTYRAIPLIPVAFAAALAVSARSGRVDWRHYLAVPAITLGGAGFIYLVVRTLL